MNIHRSPKEDITRADIRALIAPFYDRVRANPDIGPVFENRIGNSDSVWADHLDKIEDFWANVMLHDRAYQGNPMQAHMAMPELRERHFQVWLDLFQATAREVLPQRKADLFDQLAHRIGQSLWVGMNRVRGNDVPNLAFGEMK